MTSTFKFKMEQYLFAYQSGIKGGQLGHVLNLENAINNPTIF